MDRPQVNSFEEIDANLAELNQAKLNQSKSNQATQNRTSRLGQFPTFRFSRRRMHGLVPSGVDAEGRRKYCRHGQGPDRRQCANAKVTVTDIERGTNLETTTNDSGEYVVGPLRVGTLHGHG